MTENSKTYEDLKIDLPNTPTVGDLVKALKKFDQTAIVYVTATYSDTLFQPSLVSADWFSGDEEKYTLIDLVGCDIHRVE